MQFRARPEGFKVTRDRVITRMVVLVVSVYAITSGPDLFSDDPESRQTSLMMIIILGLLVTFTTIATLKKLKERYLSMHDQYHFL